MQVFSEKKKFVSQEMINSLAPESEIDSQISRLSNKVAELDQRLGTLGVRLQPVMSPRASEGECGTDVTEQNVSPIASRVRSIGYSVDSLTARVEAMLGSLAV